ncbi:MAG: hypothetical protein K2O14_11865 [Oscillospiraceae bacterium]|nr:hypothetical protein [Oscillospiraceae bacterium]
MATKTVTLTGAEQRVDELGGLNALIVNNTTQPLYASARAGIEPYADGVIEIKAGASRGLPDTNGTVYLLGNGGRAELTGTSASVNFNVPSSSSEGGGGITRDEVNDIVMDKIAEVIADAPEDLDTLKEISDWIAGHENDAAAMNSEIKANAADISDIQTEQQTQNSDISTLQTNMEQKADISEVSNPNLLDNPDFKINQRGQSEYIGASIYTVDRWRTINNTKVKVFDDHIEIEQMGTTQTSIMQYCENISELAGKTVTFSAEVRGDGIHIPKLQFVNSDGVDMYAIGTNSTDWQIISLTTVISNNADVNNNFPRIYVSTDNTNKPIIGVKWAKLELGNHATPFVPPNPALELLKCQRYFLSFTGASNTAPGEIIGVGYFSNPTTFRVMLSTPVTMRAVPGFTSNDLGVTVNGTEIIVLRTGAMRWLPAAASVTMDFYTDVAVEKGAIALLRLAGHNGSKLELSADL